MSEGLYKRDVVAVRDVVAGLFDGRDHMSVVQGIGEGLQSAADTLPDDVVNGLVENLMEALMSLEADEDWPDDDCAVPQPEARDYSGWQCGNCNSYLSPTSGDCPRCDRGGR